MVIKNDELRKLAVKGRLLYTTDSMILQFFLNARNFYVDLNLG